ncbi:hypothetical protein ACOSQ3_005054 [Xanthoceras sorbifolium]
MIRLSPFLSSPSSHRRSLLFLTQPLPRSHFPHRAPLFFSVHEVPACRRRSSVLHAVVFIYQDATLNSNTGHQATAATTTSLPPTIR